MRVDVLVAEIGSTVTKVHAFRDLDTRRPRWLGSGSAPTTVRQGDVTVGLRRATAELASRLGEPVEWGRMLAASSAAGGLRMSVHGLVRDMTVRAAREAALGAGAILDLVTAGPLGPTEVDLLRRLEPGIVLLAGGVEDGDREVVVHNAQAVASSGVRAPVVYAGNSAAREEAVSALRRAGLEVTVVANVYPRLDQLEVEPARRAIQEVFERHIVAAPGMERVRDLVGGTIRPTPGAVMQAARALRPSLGDLVVLDVGGATTDVHSVTDGSTEVRRLLVHPEPVAKRTVEGDLGVYVNARNVVRLAGEEEVAAYMAALGWRPPGGSGAGGSGGGLLPDPPAAARAVRDLLDRLEPMPPERTEPDQAFLVEALAWIAAETALVRHAGRLHFLFGPTGRLTVAEGKDLTEVEWLIGTGGPLTRFPHGRRTLSRLAGVGPGRVEARVRRGAFGAGPVAGSAGPPGGYLLPGSGARPLLDSRYVLAVLGVLHDEYPEAAEVLLRESLPDRPGDGGGPPRG
ncbi:MAG: glutamate mutase L [Firmicutes bacterium]|nr:glutamate mutase L [Bacillota bacterium]